MKHAEIQVLHEALALLAEQPYVSESGAALIEQTRISLNGEQRPHDERMNSVLTSDDLSAHIGHRVVIVTYGNSHHGVVNIALECEDCCEVLADCDPA